MWRIVECFFGYRRQTCGRQWDREKWGRILCNRRLRQEKMAMTVIDNPFSVWNLPIKIVVYDIENKSKTTHSSINQRQADLNRNDKRIQKSKKRPETFRQKVGFEERWEKLTINRICDYAVDSTLNLSKSPFARDYFVRDFVGDNQVWRVNIIKKIIENQNRLFRIWKGRQADAELSSKTLVANESFAFRWKMFAKSYGDSRLQKQTNKILNVLLVFLCFFMFLLFLKISLSPFLLSIAL